MVGTDKRERLSSKKRKRERERRKVSIVKRAGRGNDIGK